MRKFIKVKQLSKVSNRWWFILLLLQRLPQNLLLFLRILPILPGSPGQWPGWPKPEHLWFWNYDCCELPSPWYSSRHILLDWTRRITWIDTMILNWLKVTNFTVIRGQPEDLNIFFTCQRIDFEAWMSGQVIPSQLFEDLNCGFRANINSFLL